MLERQSGARDFPSSSQQGIYGVRDGFLPTIGDAMEIFDESWHGTPCSRVMKRWMKSECQPESHVHRCNEKLRDIVPNLRENRASLEDPIPHSEIGHTQRDLNLVESLDIPHTPASVILEEANFIYNTLSLDEVLNSLAPFGTEPSRSEISYSLLQNFFDS